MRADSAAKYCRAVRYPQIVSIEARTRFWRVPKLHLPAKTQLPPARKLSALKLAEHKSDCEISGLERAVNVDFAQPRKPGINAAGDEKQS
jgi:hypothetical protein